MTKQVSKEYIQAMNGILNGEKWFRDKWLTVGAKRLIEKPYIYNDDGEVFFHYIDLFNNKHSEEDNYLLNLEDMQATDWERVDDKTN